MNISSVATIVLCILPVVGFAFRGIVLLAKSKSRPVRVISFSGCVAMVSMWVFAGFLPHVALSAQEIFAEFDMSLNSTTQWLLSTMTWPIVRLGLIWYPIAFGLGICALVIPEIFLDRTSATSVEV